MENTFYTIQDIVKSSQANFQEDFEDNPLIGEESKSQVCKIFETSRKGSKGEELQEAKEEIET